MNKPRTVLTGCLALSVYAAIAQSVSPSVISTAGGIAANDAGSLSYTIGEMAMIETFSAPGHFLTQGFQQPWDFITSIEDELSLMEVGVYPNPANDFFYIQLNTSAYHRVRATLADALGQLAAVDIIALDGGTVVHKISTAHLPTGVYVLSLAGLDQHQEPALPLSIKIHIAN